ncbi:MAG: GNAT family N-acetyltransferase [Rhodothalassiaceae bacterium]
MAGRTVSILDPSTMAPFSFTAFSDADRAAVFGLFQLNVPDYFQASEQADLAATLEAPDGPHWVRRRDGEVIGYGGFEIGTAYNRVVLTWGMVRNDLHRQGLGRALRPTGRHRQRR